MILTCNMYNNSLRYRYHHYHLGLINPEDRIKTIPQLFKNILPHLLHHHQLLILITPKKHNHQRYLYRANPLILSCQLISNRKLPHHHQPQTIPHTSPYQLHQHLTHLNRLNLPLMAPIWLSLSLINHVHPHQT